MQIVWVHFHNTGSLHSSFRRYPSISLPHTEEVWSSTKIIWYTTHTSEKGKTVSTIMTDTASIFYVLLTVHLSIILGNDQLDTQLLYFTIRLLWSSTCFEHYMFIIRRLNCIYAVSGIITLKMSGLRLLAYNLLHCSKLYASNLRPLTYFQSDDTRCCINTIQPPDDEHRMLETYRES